MREEPVKVDEASGGHHTGGSSDFFRQTLTVSFEGSEDRISSVFLPPLETLLNVNTKKIQLEY